MPVPSSKSSFHRLLALAHVMFCNSTLSSVICISVLQLHDFLIFYEIVPDTAYKNKPITHLMFRTCGVTFCPRFYVQLYLKFCTYARSLDNMSPFPCPCPPPNLTFCCSDIAYNLTWITPEFFLTQTIFLLTGLHNVWTCVFFVFHTFLAKSNPYTRVGILIVTTIYLQLIQNRYMFRSFTVLQCSHQHCVQPVASDVEVVGYL